MKVKNCLELKVYNTARLQNQCNETLLSTLEIKDSRNLYMGHNEHFLFKEYIICVMYQITMNLG